MGDAADDLINLVASATNRRLERQRSFGPNPGGSLLNLAAVTWEDLLQGSQQLGELLAACKMPMSRRERKRSSALRHGSAQNSSEDVMASFDPPDAASQLAMSRISALSVLSSSSTAGSPSPSPGTSPVASPVASSPPAPPPPPGPPAAASAVAAPVPPRKSPKPSPRVPPKTAPKTAPKPSPKPSPKPAPKPGAHAGRSNNASPTPSAEHNANAAAAGGASSVFAAAAAAAAARSGGAAATPPPPPPPPPHEDSAASLGVPASAKASATFSGGRQGSMVSVASNDTMIVHSDSDTDDTNAMRSLRSRNFFTRRQTVPDVAAEPLPESLEQALAEYPWFVGSRTRDEAEALLKGHPPGTTLVRVSQQHFALTVKHTNDVFNHILIRRDEDNTRFCISESEVFNSIPELVHYYQLNSSDFSTRLWNDPSIPITTFHPKSVSTV